MSDEPIGLGRRIVWLRDARGWTQAELAHRTGIKRPALNQVETGARTNPGIQFVARLAQVFEVSIDYLIGRKDTETESVPTGAAWAGT